jgi:hypothetical protein
MTRMYSQQQQQQQQRFPIINATICDPKSMSALKAMLLLQANKSLAEKSEDESSVEPAKVAPKKKKVATEKTAKQIGKQLWKKAYDRLKDKKTEYGVFTEADLKHFPPFAKMRKCVDKYEFTAPTLAKKPKVSGPAFCFEPDCSDLLEKPAVTNGLLSLVDIMSSAIISAGMTKNVEASGLFNDLDVNLSVSVFFGK